ncbi:hypothetical protein JCM10908_006459 [Rhodotorula pacifica]|uniref:uncharacterized protein n=1 Tax=Rhodotorula pacifica TaxID=1495444 RepID=UPI0031729942
MSSVIGSSARTPSALDRRYAPVGSAPFAASSGRRLSGPKKALIALALLALVLTVVIVPPAVILTRKKNDANARASAEQIGYTTIVDGTKTFVQTRTASIVSRSSLSTNANGEISTVVERVTLPVVTVSATALDSAVQPGFETVTVGGEVIIQATVTRFVAGNQAAVVTRTALGAAEAVATVVETVYSDVTVTGALTRTSTLPEPSTTRTTTVTSSAIATTTTSSPAATSTSSTAAPVPSTTTSTEAPIPSTTTAATSTRDPITTSQVTTSASTTTSLPASPPPASSSQASSPSPSTTSRPEPTTTASQATTTLPPTSSSLPPTTATSDTPPPSSPSAPSVSTSSPSAPSLSTSPPATQPTQLPSASSTSTAPAEPTTSSRRTSAATPSSTTSTTSEALPTTTSGAPPTTTSGAVSTTTSGAGPSTASNAVPTTTSSRPPPVICIAVAGDYYTERHKQYLIASASKHVLDRYISAYMSSGPARPTGRMPSGDLEWCCRISHFHLTPDAVHHDPGPGFDDDCYAYTKHHAYLERQYLNIDKRTTEHFVNWHFPSDLYSRTSSPAWRMPFSHVFEQWYLVLCLYNASFA